MPDGGEARKRATHYEDEVMIPMAQTWDEQAVPHEVILPNKKPPPEGMMSSDDDDDEKPKAAQ